MKRAAGCGLDFRPCIVGRTAFAAPVITNSFATRFSRWVADLLLAILLACLRSEPTCILRSIRMLSAIRLVKC